jgi:hypothetical protein
MNLNADTQTQVMTSSGATLTLSVRNLGHVPSFKNSKEIVPGKKGRRSMLITKPERQKWMKDAVESFTSQLRSALAMRGIATMTGPIPLSKIASLLPLDDSRKWIPSHSVVTLLVSKRNEGATIEITRIK